MRRWHSDIKTIYPLLQLCKVLAITPPHTFGKPAECPKSFNYYAKCMVVALIFGYLFSIYGKRNNEVLKNRDSISSLLDFVAIAFLEIASISVVMINAIWKPHKFNMLLLNIEKFDNTVGFTVGRAKPKFWITYIIFQISTCATILVDSFAWIKIFGIKVYCYYFTRNVSWYQLSVTIFLMFWLTLEIKRRFREINCLLLFCAKGINSSFLVPSLLNEYSIGNRKDKPFYIKVPDAVLLKTIKFWYKDFVNLIEEFNSVFGFILLFTVLFNIANVVHYTHVIMIYIVYQKNTNSEVEIILTGLLWIAVAIVQIIIIAASCELLSKEAKRTTTICYILLSEVPSLPTSYYNGVLREELLLLAEETAISYPKISAAGFFEVNLGMMGFILASVTSYIIVTIQFK